MPFLESVANFLAPRSKISFLLNKIRHKNGEIWNVPSAGRKYQLSAPSFCNRLWETHIGHTADRERMRGGANELWLACEQREWPVLLLGCGSVTLWVLPCRWWPWSGVKGWKERKERRENRRKTVWVIKYMKWSWSVQLQKQDKPIRYRWTIFRADCWGRIKTNETSIINFQLLHVVRAVNKVVCGCICVEKSCAGWSPDCCVWCNN